MKPDIIFVIVNKLYDRCKFHRRIPSQVIIRELPYWQNSCGYKSYITHVSEMIANNQKPWRCNIEDIFIYVAITVRSCVRSARQSS